MVKNCDCLVSLTPWITKIGELDGRIIPIQTNMTFNLLSERFMTLNLKVYEHCPFFILLKLILLILICNRVLQVYVDCPFVILMKFTVLMLFMQLTADIFPVLLQYWWPAGGGLTLLWQIKFQIRCTFSLSIPGTWEIKCNNSSNHTPSFIQVRALLRCSNELVLPFGG